MSATPKVQTVIFPLKPEQPVSVPLVSRKKLADFETEIYSHFECKYTLEKLEITGDTPVSILKGHKADAVKMIHDFPKDDVIYFPMPMQQTAGVKIHIPDFQPDGCKDILGYYEAIGIRMLRVSYGNDVHLIPKDRVQAVDDKIIMCHAAGKPATTQNVGEVMCYVVAGVALQNVYAYDLPAHVRILARMFGIQLLRITGRGGLPCWVPYDPATFDAIIRDFNLDAA